ncbi:hypothetical protein CNMCM5793_000518 [Aspergillus hiratsukae]|uniref:Xylanolytic transcriptional activator regulatory domain-containing protein n=1 Tax=Aspergillus hiratsukae TaxID=1194566 RepID=A0A8H6PAC7_9EURO|nr:hypothetical protein CNMCM5793_000518 [Aspergillus hiratsukae]KAF7156969.1 hypothetical protein CNMCM6106_001748 [Aspergillus hiratsukae]
MNNPPNSTPTANVACLIALTAMVTQMHRLEPGFADADPDAYMQTVLTLLPRILMEEISLRSLETVVILFSYILPIGQARSASLLLAMAVRMLYSLGGNRYSVIHEVEGSHLRALFWLCYGLDKDMAIRFGYPPLMKDEDCDLQLPDNYVLSSSDHQFFMKPLSSQELLFPSDIRLSLIKSKLYRLLYSDYARGQPQARRLQYIRELDQEIRDLKSSFPASCWPDFFATENERNYSFHDLSIRGVNLHLEYYFCLGRIHSAVRPYSQEWSFLPSSADLFYQESRSMLLYISRIRDFLNWHTFWIHAQFILTAVLSLFRHLITEPNAPTFGNDLRLLESIVEIFADLDHESRATRRFAPFSFTAGLTRRLIFLAKQAHRKFTDQ